MIILTFRSWSWSLNWKCSFESQGISPNRYYNDILLFWALNLKILITFKLYLIDLILIWIKIIDQILSKWKVLILKSDKLTWIYLRIPSWCILIILYCNIIVFTITKIIRKSQNIITNLILLKHNIANNLNALRCLISQNVIFFLAT